MSNIRKATGVPVIIAVGFFLSSEFAMAQNQDLTVNSSYSRPRPGRDSITRRIEDGLVWQRSWQTGARRRFGIGVLCSVCGR